MSKINRQSLETSIDVNLRPPPYTQMPSKSNSTKSTLGEASQDAKALENTIIAQAQNMRIPEFEPVILLEQLIFYLFSVGLLVIVRGPHGTLPIMPSSVLLANLLSFLISLCVFVLFILLRNQRPSVLKYLGVAQEVAFVFMFMYNLQFIVFSLLLRIFHSELEEDQGDIRNDWFIMLFNGSKSNVNGYAVSTLHMVVTLVLCVFFFVLFLTSHSFLRRIYHSKSMEWTLILSILFIQSQFFLFHVDQMHHSLEMCDMFMCDEIHNLWAGAVILGIWFVDFTGHVFKDNVLMQERVEGSNFTLPYLKYFAVHVLVLPVGGLVAVHFVSWLKHDYFYTVNVVFLSLFLAVRLLGARKVFLAKKSGAGVNSIEIESDRVVSGSFKFNPSNNKNQTSLFGTPQPKYFFRKQGRNNKRD